MPDPIGMTICDQLRMRQMMLEAQIASTQAFIDAYRAMFASLELQKAGYEIELAAVLVDLADNNC